MNPYVNCSTAGSCPWKSVTTISGWPRSEDPGALRPLLVFSTNLEPKELVDEAFLRRIPYKINVVDPTEEEFRELFRIMAGIFQIEHDEQIVSYVIE